MPNQQALLSAHWYCKTTWTNSHLPRHWWQSTAHYMTMDLAHCQCGFQAPQRLRLFTSINHTSRGPWGFLVQCFGVVELCSFEGWRILRRSPTRLSTEYYATPPPHSSCFCHLWRHCRRNSSGFILDCSSLSIPSSSACQWTTVSYRAKPG